MSKKQKTMYLSYLRNYKAISNLSTTILLVLKKNYRKINTNQNKNGPSPAGICLFFGLCRGGV